MIDDLMDISNSPVSEYKDHDKTPTHQATPTKSQATPVNAAVTPPPSPQDTPTADGDLDSTLTSDFGYPLNIFKGVCYM